MAFGEHIYVEDSFGGIPFQHHGIDVGQDRVIHLAPEGGPRLTLKDDSQLFVVRETTLEQFAGSRTVRIKRHEAARSADEVVQAARSMIGKSGYSLLEGNCEHFAVYCATGQWVSQQIEMGQATVASLTSAATKVVWSLSARTVTQTVVRTATKVHPAAILADGVEVLALMVSSRRGMKFEQAQRVARISGRLAAAGVGVVVAGPVGCATALAVHEGSRAVADRLCRNVRQWLG